jgi:DNA-binding transcriptional MocR family regulator
VPEVIGQPAYRRLAGDLRTKIESGELRVGDPIPSTSQMCMSYGVSATVARAAVAELRAEGILRGQPGKAVYVVATPDAVRADGVDLAHVDHRVDLLTRKVERLARGGGAPEVEQIQNDLGELRRQMALIQANLIDLYGKLGQVYPHDSTTAEGKRRSRRPTRKASGGA